MVKETPSTVIRNNTKEELQKLIKEAEAKTKEADERFKELDAAQKRAEEDIENRAKQKFEEVNRYQATKQEEIKKNKDALQAQFTKKIEELKAVTQANDDKLIEIKKTEDGIEEVIKAEITKKIDALKAAEESARERIDELNALEERESARQKASRETPEMKNTANYQPLSVATVNNNSSTEEDEVIDSSITETDKETAQGQNNTLITDTERREDVPSQKQRSAKEVFLELANKSQCSDELKTFIQKNTRFGDRQKARLGLGKDGRTQYLRNIYKLLEG